MEFTHDTKAPQKKTNMAMENPQFEDVFIVFPIEHRDIGGFPANPSLRSSGGFLRYVNAAPPTTGGTFTQNEQSTGHKGPQPEIFVKGGSCRGHFF